MDENDRGSSGSNRPNPRQAGPPRPGVARARHGTASGKPREKLTGKLSKVQIEGFKSLKNVELELNDINVFVGANGAGKSNTLGLFEMLSWMVRGQNLQVYIPLKGGGDDLLFNGARQTQSIHVCLSFAHPNWETQYQFRLQRTENNRLVFTEESYRFTPTGKEKGGWLDFGVGHLEAKITDKANEKKAQITKTLLANCYIYQFHDTSAQSPIKKEGDASDIRALKNNGGNLAAVLLDLGENHGRDYDEIVRTIRKVLPVFEDFDLQILYGRVQLRWRQQGVSDKSFGAHLTSDGTLRLMALVTLLCMPEERLPNVILLDEPELGLHPYAISIIAALIKRVATKKQVIVATQSPLLLNEFSIENIIVTEMGKNGDTRFKRLKEADFLEWLDEFRTGDLWQKNVIGGNPV